MDMSSLILYFSGTGNTEYVAGYLQRKLASLSVDAHLASIEHLKPEQTQDFDLLIIGFPIYAGAPPQFFKQYLDTLPKVRQKGLFVFCTKAMFTGQAIADVCEGLSGKGYVPIDYLQVGMPGSDALPFMSKESKYVQKALHKNYETMEEINEFAQKIAAAVNSIKQGKRVDSLRGKVSKGLPVLNALFQGIWDFGYGFAEKKIKPNFQANDQCVHCLQCVKQCPAKNISIINGKISFADRCYMCMRCINQCPQEAIQIGKRTLHKFRWKGPRGDFKPH
ncbi:flavodoxin [Desulfosporosinus orientis DSM 765]|uniref:Ferredoxin n=1 Tax=Desulfosporosinus orientis (strain ATCC 19365 / DSM 765 / NCIMB 8382 / VKM B-1628 / Singapore I) TaxID=768706 RepID=G7WIK0_DESOD|nr:EFR1 family ferrodoxin [Desulfosporosinus orientis]AET69074.1 flavodoxin [Desulfosporosinus orientis DSM 765]